jgi:hypothetical protein
MKTKKSANKRMFRLNKQTIANLNRLQMLKVGGGGNLQGVIQYPETQDLEKCGGPTPVPTDGGITPLISDLFNCN